MHLLAKFGPPTLYVFVENEAVSSWAVNNGVRIRNWKWTTVSHLPSYNLRTVSRIEKNYGVISKGLLRGRRKNWISTLQKQIC